MIKQASRYGVILFLMVIGSSFLVSCNKKKNGFVSKAWHNTSARYNAYFLAKERLLEVEGKLMDNHKDDYNRILEIYPQYDSTFSKSLKGDLDYIFEYASIAPQKHENSHWVDDSYILVGKVKLYASKLDSAELAFRYVNTITKDPEAKQEALIFLLRTYLQEDKMRMADNVNEYLKKEKITAKKEKDFYLISAQYFRKKNNRKNMLEFVQKAIPLEKNRYKKSRLNFIAGQLSQEFGQNEDAYKHYRKALKGQPPYELEFFSKLMMSQVADLKNKSIKKIYKYFNKLLKDTKNTEYRDKIFYEMAKFELRRSDTNKGLEFVDSSLTQIGGSDFQKAYTYLLAGKTFYTRKDMNGTEKYKISKKYYDSTVAIMPDQWPEFDDITERQLTLAEFVKEIESIEIEDSLRRISKMSPEEQDKMIAKAMAKEKDRIKEEKLRAEREQARKEKENSVETPVATNNFQEQNSAFPFYSPAMLLTSQSKFIAYWGDRKLADNWRRSYRDDISFDEEKAEKLNDTVTVSENKDVSAQETLKDKKGDDKNQEEEIVLNKEDFLKNIPTSTEDMEKSTNKLIASLYNLGKIYYLRLEEPENALVTFKRLITEFPGNEYHAEVLYFLFIISQRTGLDDAAKYLKELEDKYPHSIYTKLAQNPNYLQDNKVGNAIADAEYEKAYEMYQAGSFISALKQIQKTIADYPKSNSLDKMHFLRLLCYIKTDQSQNYNDGLIAFQAEFPTSELVPKAQRLLDQHNQYVSNKPVVADTYLRKDSLAHYVIGVFANDKIDYKYSISVFYEFNKTYYKDINFSTRRVDFSEKYHLITLKELSKDEALAYVKKMEHYNEFGLHYKNAEYNYYIISSENYEILSNIKNLDEYRRFYAANYR